MVRIVQGTQINSKWGFYKFWKSFFSCIKNLTEIYYGVLLFSVSSVYCNCKIVIAQNVLNQSNSRFFNLKLHRKKFMADHLTSRKKNIYLGKEVKCTHTYTLEI